MNKAMAARLVFFTTVVLALPAASFAQLKVITSGGFRAAFQGLLPDFEKTTWHHRHRDGRSVARKWTEHHRGAVAQGRSRGRSDHVQGGTRRTDRGG